MSRRTLAVLIGAIVAAGVVTAAIAGHKWESETSLPDAREGGCTGVIGNDIYIAYGFGPATGDSATLFGYDISSDTWSDLTPGSPPPTPARSEGSEAVHGGKLYCIGGRGGIGLLADLDRFDPATAAWKSLADMPTALAGTASAVRGNAIYVFGGRTGTGGPCSGPAVDTIYRYDIDADAWTLAGTLNVARSDASAVEQGGKIYVFGGCDFGGPFDSIELFDPNSGTSSLLTTVLPVPVASAGAAAGGSDIHVMGGVGSGNAHQVFDVPSQAFGPAGTPLPAASCPPLASRGEFDLLAHGGRLWAVAGACPAFGASIADLDSLKLAP